MKVPQVTWTAMKVESLDENQREFFEERAAIYEFEAGFSREKAEQMALAETLKKLGIGPG